MKADRRWAPIAVLAVASALFPASSNGAPAIAAEVEAPGCVDLGSGWQQLVPSYPTRKDLLGRDERGVTATLAVNPLDERIILAIGTTGFVKSTDGGCTWKDVPAWSKVDALGQPNIKSVQRAAANGQAELLALRQVGNQGPVVISRTRDWGDSWEDVSPQGLPAGGDALELAVARTNPKVMYMLVMLAPYELAVSELYASEDGGATWTRRTNGLESAPTSQALGRLGDTYVAGPTNVAVDPLDPQRVWIVRGDDPYAGVWMSRDGGRQWQRVGPDWIVPEGRARVHIDIAPARDGSRRVLLTPSVKASGLESLAISHDEGRTWAAVAHPDTTLEAAFLGARPGDILAFAHGVNPGEGIVYRYDSRPAKWADITPDHVRPPYFSAWFQSCCITLGESRKHVYMWFHDTIRKYSGRF